MAWMLYIINWLCAAMIAYAFIRTKKETAASRPLLIQTQLTLAWYQLGWGLIYYVDANIVLWSLTWYIINLPFTVAIIRVTIYVVKHHILWINN